MELEVATMNGRETRTKPLRVEVVSMMLGIQTEECKNCRLIFADVGLKGKFADREINEYPDDVKEEVLRLSDWIRELTQLYPYRIQFKVIDAVSPLGLYKKLRHRIKTFPAFIVDNRETYSGWDKEALEGLLDRHLQMRPA